MTYNADDEILVESGRREMELTAYSLPTPSATKGPPIRMCVLTGDRYWYQAAFGLWSLSAVSGREVAPIIFDDGSLRLDHQETFRRIFPKLRFVGASESLERLDAFLPENHYPSLREQHRSNPIYKKLLDIHAEGTEWRLQMDSDILFFRSPDFLLNWHDAPYSSLYLEDIKNAYSGSVPYLSELLGKPVRQRVNAGVLGIRSGEIDWEQMEYWSKKLVEHGGSRHHMEQTLYALHLSECECVTPDPKEYLILPDPPESHKCEAVMHHYVAHSRKWLLQGNWRRFVTKNTQVTLPN